MEENQENRVIVITGASSGFGKGAALAFAAQGARLVLAARRGDLLDDLVDACEELGGEAFAVAADVSNANDVAEIATRALASWGRIDVWVNNAGAAAVGRFDEVPLADHVKVVCTDLLGPIFGSYFALQQFRRQKAGTLINVASILGKVASPYHGSYAASKHGVVGLSAALRAELAINDEDEDIHVCTVLPTAMDTPFFDHEANYTGRATSPPPLKDPQEVVDAIVNLVEKPEDEVIVGGDGKLLSMIHAVAPSLAEGRMARQTHKAQVVDAPPGEPTRGALHEPMEEGTGVSAGRRFAQER